MNQIQTAMYPEELVSRLVDFPDNWKGQIDAFASKHLNLEPVIHSNGDPVLRRRDGHVARVGLRNGSYLFASTSKKCPSLIAAGDIPVTAADLVARLVQFANESEDD